MDNSTKNQLWQHVSAAIEVDITLGRMKPSRAQSHRTQSSTLRLQRDRRGAPNAARTDIAHDRKALEIAIDLHWKAAAQLADVLARGVNYYLLIVAAAVTLLFQAKLSPSQSQVIAILIVGVSVIVALIVITGIWLLLRVLQRIKSTIKLYNENIASALFSASRFSASRLYGVIALLLCISIIALLAGAIGLILLP